MKILALETSAKAVSAAITENGVVLASGYQDTGLTHSRTLMPIVKHLFQNTGIGVSAAKGLAFSLDKPAAAVSTLAAMARNAAFAGGLILCAMDARRGQIYNAVFSAEGGVLTRLTPDRAISLAELAEELRPDARPKIAVGDGARLCADFLNQTGIPCQLAPPHLMMQNAMSVALEAEALALEGRLVDAQALLPVYLRPPQAERLRKAERR